MSSAQALVERGRKLAARRVVFATGFVVAVLVGAVYVISPANLGWAGSFIASPPTHPDAAVSPGDHLQMAYYIWLWQNWFSHFNPIPWVDIYQFTAVADVTRQPFGWPMVLLSVPVGFLFGPVAAYNGLVYFAFVACAGVTYVLTRQLGMSRSASLVAGFAFAFAPFRLVQGTGHVNALLSPMLPLLLLVVELALTREQHRIRWIAAVVAVQASIVLSGELHLAKYSLLLLVVYAAVRFITLRPAHWRRLLIGSVVLAAVTAACVYFELRFFLKPSVASGGRSVEEAAIYAPRFEDFFNRDLVAFLPMFTERYAYLGIVIFALAVVGAVVCLLQKQNRMLLAGLAVIAAVAFALAIIPGLTGHPNLVDAMRAIPFMSFARVSGRIVIVIALVLAIMAALAIDVIRNKRARIAVAGAAIVALLIDTPTGLFGKNPVSTAAIESVPAGSTTLSFPVFSAGHASASVNSFYLTAKPGPSVNGYSPFVTPDAADAVSDAQRLHHSDVQSCDWMQFLTHRNIDIVMVNRPLFGPNPVLQWEDRLPHNPDELVGQLNDAPGFEPLSDVDGIAVFEVDRAALTCGSG